VATHVSLGYASDRFDTLIGRLTDMTFALFKVVWAIVRPGNLLALTIAFGVLLWLFGGGRWKRGGMVLTTLGAAGLLALMILPLGTWVMAPIEQRIPPVPLPDRIDGIVILGGSTRPASTQPNKLPATNESAERLIQSLALARQHPDARVVFTGGSISLVGDVEPEADVVRLMFEQLGFTGDRFIYEDRSRNTRENALFTRELVSPAEGETWVLVTSASHMPRSLAVFEAVGWNLFPLPVDYRAGDHSEPVYDMVVSDELELFELGIREWLGLIAYRLRGWTKTFWPENALGSAALDQASG